MDQREGGVPATGSAGGPECVRGSWAGPEAAFCGQQALPHQQGKKRELCEVIVNLLTRLHSLF